MGHSSNHCRDELIDGDNEFIKILIHTVFNKKHDNTDTDTDDMTYNEVLIALMEAFRYAITIDILIVNGVDNHIESLTATVCVCV